MAFRSAATTAHGSTDWTANAPSGVTAGDREIALVSQDNAGATVTFPSGFGTPQSADLSGPDSQTVWVAERVVAGGDSYAFTSSTSNSGVTHILAFSGRHASTASTFGTATQNTSSNPSPISASCNGVTAANGDDVALVLGIDITSSGATASWSTPPTNYTQRSASSSSLGCALTCSRDNVSAGATGALTGTITLSAGNAGYGGYAIAIPASGGGASPALDDSGVSPGTMESQSSPSVISIW